MKRSLLLSLAVFVMAASFAATPIPTAKIEVWFFHYKCKSKTCLAVENVSRDAVLSQYPVKVKKNQIFFKSIYLGDPEGAAMAKKCKVQGQVLVVIVDDRRVDLTEKAFMYAKKHPEKLKEEIKKAIDGLINP